jgi:Acetamidase/Formamidase family
VPTGPCGLAGLRTLPPHENGGNFDVKQLTKGAKLFLPVFKEGGPVSIGDGHFAQATRSLRHRGRDGRYRGGAVQGVQGFGAAAQI